MIGANILYSIQSLVDMFFVGKLGFEALAAVGMASQTLMIVITVFIGINISTMAMVSRAVGAQDSGHASHVAGQSLLLTAVISIVLGVAGYASAPSILSGLGAKGEVVILGTGYLHVIFVGLFFLASAFIISAIFYGAGDAKTPFLLGLLMTVCNVILNPLFIFGYLGFPEMGVRGSAVATLIARAITFVVGITILMRGKLHVPLHLKNLVPKLHIMWTIIAIGVPSSLQMTARVLMNLALMALVARFGVLAVAAYTVGLRIRMIGLLLLFGFAGAAATMVGQNLGAKQPDRSERSAYTACALGVATAFCTGLIFFVFARHLIAPFNHEPDVIVTGASFLRITAIGLLPAAIAIILGRAMNGAGDTISPLIITFACLWGFQIPAAVYMSGIQEMWGTRIPFTDLFQRISTNGEIGIWYAMVAASVLQAIVTAAWFAVGRWKHKKV